MSEEQKSAPPPFKFGEIEDAFTLDEKYCYDNNVFGWLRAFAGTKKVEWLSKRPGNCRGYLDYCISIRIKDPATEIQFRFMHAEHEVKVVRDEKGYLTHVRKQ